MRNYSIDQYNLTWQNLDFAEGLAAGSSFVEARTTPAFTMKMSARGKGIRVYNTDRSGTTTILVNSESKLNQDLRALAKQDRLTRDVVGAMVGKDSSSGEQFTYKNAFIVTEPDETRATESTDVAWVFMWEDIDKTVSTDQNLVGS